MRAAIIGLMGLATCGTCDARTEPADAPIVRRVQLIIMGKAPDPKPGQGDDDIWTGDSAALLAAEVSTDRNHIYTVKQQMFRRLQPPAASGQSIDTLASGVSKTIDPAERLTPVSAISVPAWMRTGPLIASRTWRYAPGCILPGYRKTGFLRPDAERRRAFHYALMSQIACEHGIPVALFDAMIIRESRYRPAIVSPKNAFGLTQLMPGTAKDLGVDRYSVEGNLRGGARYLRQQLDRFGQYHLALAAYNAGPGRVRGGTMPQIRETQAYVVNVLSNWSRLSGVNGQTRILPMQGSAPQVHGMPSGHHRAAAVLTYGRMPVAVRRRQAPETRTTRTRNHRRR